MVKGQRAWEEGMGAATDHLGAGDLDGAARALAGLIARDDGDPGDHYQARRLLAALYVSQGDLAAAAAAWRLPWLQSGGLWQPWQHLSAWHALSLDLDAGALPAAWLTDLDALAAACAAHPQLAALTALTRAEHQRRLGEPAVAVAAAVYDQAHAHGWGDLLIASDLLAARALEGVNPRDGLARADRARAHLQAWRAWAAQQPAPPFSPLDPDQLAAQTHTTLATLALRCGDAPRARAALDALSQHQPQGADALTLCLRAQLACLESDPWADTWLQEALQRAADDRQPHLQATLLRLRAMRAPSLSERMDWLQAALPLAAPASALHARVLLDLAHALLSRGDLASAQPLLAAAPPLPPTWQAERLRLDALLAAAHADHGRALALLEDALRLDEAHDQFQAQGEDALLIAATLRRLRRPDDAYAALRRAQSLLTPPPASLWVERARLSLLKPPPADLTPARALSDLLPLLDQPTPGPDLPPLLLSLAALERATAAPAPTAPDRLRAALDLPASPLPWSPTDHALLSLALAAFTDHDPEGAAILEGWCYS